MRILKGLILVIVLTLVGQSSPQQNRSKLNPKTRDNVMAAMKGEAFAYAKYMLYAEHARRNGHPEIADLFERAAKTELSEHFRELAQLAQLVGSDAENLQAAEQGENYETETMYPKFADEAAAVGDTTAAERFREISQDELNHRNAFRGALSSLEKK